MLIRTRLIYISSIILQFIEHSDTNWNFFTARKYWYYWVRTADLVKWLWIVANSAESSKFCFSGVISNDTGGTNFSVKVLWFSNTNRWSVCHNEGEEETRDSITSLKCFCVFIPAGKRASVNFTKLIYHETSLFLCSREIIALYWFSKKETIKMGMKVSYSLIVCRLTWGWLVDKIFKFLLCFISL